MDEYISKKKDLLEELENSTVKNGIIKDLVVIHKEILLNKENLLCQKKFKSIVQKINLVEEITDDFEVKIIEEDKVCPFSQKKIVNPFKNQCGHIYEREGLESYLKKDHRGQVRCPTVGCNATVSKIPKQR